MRKNVKKIQNGHLPTIQPRFLAPKTLFDKFPVCGPVYLFDDMMGQWHRCQLLQIGDHVPLHASSGFPSKHFCISSKVFLVFVKKHFMITLIEANDTTGSCCKSEITFPSSSSSFPNLYPTTAVSHLFGIAT